MNKFISKSHITKHPIRAFVFCIPALIVTILMVVLFVAVAPFLFVYLIYDAIKNNHYKDDEREREWLAVRTKGRLFTT